MNRKSLETLLPVWGDRIFKEIESSGFGSQTITYKLMKCGVMTDSGVFQLPNYWPKEDLRQINDGIWSLPIESRNLLVQIYVLGLSGQDLAPEYNVSRGTIYYRRDKAIKALSKLIT